MSFPDTDCDLVPWLDQFARAVSTYADVLGLTPAEVTSVTNDAAMFSYLVRIDLPANETALAARTAYKDLIKNGPIGEPAGTKPSPPLVTLPPAAIDPGILPRLRLMIHRLKALPDYTEALGEEFGIEGVDSEARFNPAIAKPTGRAIGQPDNEVRVEFSKSAFDGVLIESRRTGQDEWRRLATDNFSPYVDSRPLARGGKPEVREYRMRFLMSDEPVGEWSDILVATASA